MRIFTGSESFEQLEVSISCRGPGLALGMTSHRDAARIRWTLAIKPEDATTGMLQQMLRREAPSCHYKAAPLHSSKPRCSTRHLKPHPLEMLSMIAYQPCNVNGTRLHPFISSCKKRTFRATQAHEPSGHNPPACSAQVPTMPLLLL